MNRLKRIISILLLTIIVLPNLVFAQANEGDKVVTLGANLTDEQRNQMLEIFGFGKEEDIRIIEITNEEERKYLGDYIDSSMLGTRAISSVYLEKQKKGKGIDIELYNISWVTEEMYKNAAITAGVEDARIIVASPFDVSGTAALTGIIKSFEDITGKEIDEDVKDIANQEIAIMGDLRDRIGSKDTIELIVRVKKEILDKGYTIDDDIRKAVEDIIQELKVNLKAEDIQKLVDFLSKLSKTNVNKEGILESIKDIRIEKGFIMKILEAIKAFISKLFE